MDIFPDKEDARTISRNWIIINREKNDIEQEILNSSLNNKYSVEISNSFMTNALNSAAQIYYNVWVGNIKDEEREDRMNLIIRYFEDKGYKINRIVNTSTLSTFKWKIRW